jgi:hypothetical protein
MFDACVCCFLPDLTDGGIDTALDRLQGEVGVTGITVPIATPPLAYVRRIPGLAGRIFHSRGGIFIQTDDQYYDRTRVKPVLSNWLKGRDPLAPVTERCRIRRLDLRLEISATLTGRMATRYPEASTKTVFGDTSPARMCLLNPDVAEWLRALAADACEHFAPAAIELADFHAGRRDLPAAELARDTSWPKQTAELLSICFCESCRQMAAHAGVPVESAARAATVRLEQILTEDIPPTDSQQPSRNSLSGLPAVLCDYTDAQHNALQRVLQDIVAAVRVPVVHLAYSDEIHSLSDSLAAGGRTISRMMLVEIDDVDVASTLNNSAFRAHWARLPLARGAQRDPQSLVRALTDVAQHGVRGVELYHYGIASPTDLTAAKQAIRFARRTAC